MEIETGRKGPNCIFSSEDLHIMPDPAQPQGMKATDKWENEDGAEEEDELASGMYNIEELVHEKKDITMPEIEQVSAHKLNGTTHGMMTDTYGLFDGK